ncbi:MAG: NAD(P)-dependent oxidoreductase [Pseudomonadota bacterium]
MTETVINVRLALPEAPQIRPVLTDPRLMVTEGPLADCAGKRVLIAFRAPHDEPLSTYDWVHIAGAGADKILPALAPGEKTPILTRTVGKMGRQIGEYVLAAILADLQKHKARQTLQQKRQWSIADTEGTWLFESDVAILGTGGVAAGIAQMLKPLAKRVTGYARTARHEEPFERILPLTDFQPTDVVINALPRTAATEGHCNDAFFARLQRSLFINIGRGETVDDAALLKALDAGSVRRAVLDVFAQEPLPPEHPFWTHPQIDVTPHVSGITRADDIAQAFNAHLPAFIAGALQSSVDAARGY